MLIFVFFAPCSTYSVYGFHLYRVLHFLYLIFTSKKLPSPFPIFLGKRKFSIAIWNRGDVILSVIHQIHNSDILVRLCLLVLIWHWTVPSSKHLLFHSVQHLLSTAQPGSSWNDLAHYLKLCWLCLQTQKACDLKLPVSVWLSVPANNYWNVKLFA